MYNVSNAYLTAIQKPAKFRRLTGTIGNVPFSDVNVASESFIINNQCSHDTEVNIGTVFMGELTAVFRGINLTGQWKDKVITPYEGLMLADQSFEDVPLGVFRVSEAIHGDNGVAVTAYDDMIKLDKPFGLSTTSGTPYDYLRMICEDCDVTLANTEQQIRALPNGTKAYVLYADNDIETYRDLLSYVAQAVCSFATINRFGQLELRQYGTEAVDTSDKYNRWTGATFSDFETFYTGISVVKIEDQSTRYVGLEPDNGLTYNLGSNPLLQYGNVDNSLQEILQGLQSINYTPFEVTRNCMPAYDLGDVIDFVDGKGDGKTGCLMSYEYKYHAAYTFEGFGSNPALASARSKEDKEIAGLMKKDAVSNKIQIYTYYNIRQLTIRNAWEEIIHVRFGSLIATRVTFQAEIRLDASLIVDGDTYNDIIGRIKYIFNGEELDYQPTETWLDGDHLLHLLYFFPIEEAKINTLSVRMKCDNGILTIAPQYIHAAVSGQGLASSSDWDGYIEVEDEFGVIETSATAEIWGITGEITVTGEVPTEIDLEDTIGVIETAQTAIHGFDVDVYVNKKPLRFLTWGEVKEFTWAEIEEEYDW